MAALVKAVCISREKGVPKTPVEALELKAGRGAEGDAHAVGGHRQVSLLARESVAKMSSLPPDLAPGAFAENILTEGLGELAVGMRLKIGGALLEVSQIGKECHSDCAIRRATGDCVMPREGVFAVVLEGGFVRPGDAAEVV